MDTKELVNIAEDMREKAHAPYSGYAVGAALEAKDGRIFTGCNIENASFSATVCAERTAFFKAVSEGAKSFSRIAIAAGPAGKPSAGGAPCGVCRQVMAEFCGPDFEIITVNGGEYETHTLGGLFPCAFSPADLDKQ